MNRKPLVLVVVTVIVVALLVSACGGGGSSTTATTAGGSAGGGNDEPTTITYQELAGFVSPLEIAEARGYLGNLKLKSVGQITGGPESVQAVATDQSDFGFAFPGTIIQAEAAGAKVKGVVSLGGVNEDTYSGIYVLDSSAIHGAKELVGKKIAVNTLGASAEAVVKIWLKEEGLSPKEVGEVELVVIPPLNAAQTLREGQVDAIEINGTYRERLEAEGGVRTLAKDYEFLGDYAITAAVLNDDFIESHPETTRTLVAGIAKAITWLQNTPAPQVIKFADKVAAENGRPEDAETIKYWKSSGITPKGGLLLQGDFPRWTKWLEEEGKIEPGQVKASETYTNEFNPYAEGSGGEG